MTGGISKDIAMKHRPLKSAESKIRESTGQYRKDRLDKKKPIKARKATKKHIRTVAKALVGEYLGPGKVGEEGNIPELLLPVAKILEKSTGKLKAGDLEIMYGVGEAIKKAKYEEDSAFYLPPGNEALTQKTIMGGEVDIVEEMQTKIMMDLTGESPILSWPGFDELQMFNRRLRRGTKDRVRMWTDGLDPVRKAEEVFKFRDDLDRFSNKMEEKDLEGLDADGVLRVFTQFAIARGDQEIAKLRKKEGKEIDTDRITQAKESEDGEVKKLGELAGNMAETRANALKAASLWSERWDWEDFVVAMGLEGTGVKDIEKSDFQKIVAQSLGLNGQDKTNLISNNVPFGKVFNKLREAGPWATSNLVSDMIEMRLPDVSKETEDTDKKEVIEGLKRIQNLDFNENPDKMSAELLSALVAMGMVNGENAANWLAIRVFKNEENSKQAAAEFIKANSGVYYEADDGAKITVKDEHKKKWNSQVMALAETFGGVDKVKVKNRESVEGILEAFNGNGDDEDIARILRDNISFSNWAVALWLEPNLTEVIKEIFNEDEQSEIAKFLE